ncbi:hypothetical protein B0H13DRAFT_2049326, partial [Mycena leptocephala]
RGRVAVSITGSILRLSLPSPFTVHLCPTRPRPRLSQLDPPRNLYLIMNILVPLPLPELGLSTRRGELPHILPVGCCGASTVFHSSAFFGRNYGTSFGLFIRYGSWMYIQRIFGPRVGFRCRLCV